jgi:hypothetical protein
MVDDDLIRVLEASDNNLQRQAARRLSELREERDMARQERDTMTRRTFELERRGDAAEARAEQMREALCSLAYGDFLSAE